MRCDFNMHKASENLVNKASSHMLWGIYWYNWFGRKFGGNIKIFLNVLFLGICSKGII